MFMTRFLATLTSTNSSSNDAMHGHSFIQHTRVSLYFVQFFWYELQPILLTTSYYVQAFFIPSSINISSLHLRNLGLLKLLHHLHLNTSDFEFFDTQYTLEQC